MAVSYPRTLSELLDIEFEESQFTLQRMHAINTLQGGKTQVREYAPSRWRCEYTTKPMRLRRKHDLDAWWSSLRGGLETFLGYDVMRPRPVDDAAGSGAISAGTSGGTTQRIDLTGLGSGYKISVGDYIGLRQSGAYGLFIVTNGGTGSSVSAFVEPNVITSKFTGAAVVDLRQAQGEFLPEGDIRWSRVGSMYRGSFSGIQKLF